MEFPVLCHLVAREFTIRGQHLISIIMYTVQLYKEDWGILRVLGCRAVALPSTERIARHYSVPELLLPKYLVYDQNTVVLSRPRGPTVDPIPTVHLILHIFKIKTNQLMGLFKYNHFKS